jgi:type I restriction enzyme S subunit
MSELPQGWAVAQVGDLISNGGLFVDGDWVESKDQDPGGNVRLTQLADIGEGYFRDRSSRFLTREKATELGCTFLAPGDVLVARMPDPLGRACLFPGDPRPCVTAVDVCIIRAGAGGIEPRWLMWWINTPQFRREIVERQAGTTRKRISRKNLASIKLPVPPLTEQQRIVAAIEEHFSRLDAADRSLAHARRRLAVLRTATLAAATAGYEPVELGSLVTELRYGTSIKCSYDAQGPPVLRIPNVQGGTVDVSDLKFATDADVDLSPFSLETGDLLFVRTNGSRDLIGRVASVNGAEGMAFASYLIRARPDASRLDARFAVIALSTPASRVLIESKAATTAGQYNLNLAALRTLPVPLPPIEQQRSIVADVDRQLSVVQATHAEVDRALRRSASLRRSILERAFSGKLVSQDLSDEPASVLLERIAAERAAAPKPSRGKRKTPA